MKGSGKEIIKTTNQWYAFNKYTEYLDGKSVFKYFQGSNKMRKEFLLSKLTVCRTTDSKCTRLIP